MPSKLAIEFIATFARAEHALKSTSYAHCDKRVEASWDRFANDIHDALQNIDDGDISEAAEYLLNHPPKIQIIREGKVTFVEQNIDGCQKKTQQIFLMIRTVQNNLFHGGKYLPCGEIEQGRNETLVKASLTVMKACIQLKADVKASFEH